MTSITVGYGDLSGTTNERIFQTFLTLVGMTSVSFVVGSLTSILFNIGIELILKLILDHGQAQLKEKIASLEKIRKENNVDDDLYMRIRKTLKNDLKKNENSRVDF